MSIVTLGGGASAKNTLTKPYDSFGGKNNIMITGCMPVGGGQYPTLGTVAPESNPNNAFAVYGKRFNTAINPLPDNSQMYTGNVNRGDFNVYIGYNGTSTGAFSYTWRCGPSLPLVSGTKISKATIQNNGSVMNSSPSVISFYSATATGVKITAKLRVLHSNGTFTDIGNDFWDYGTVGAGVTKYRDKALLTISGAEYTTVAGDYLVVEFVFEGTITANPSTSAAIQFQINQNYIQSSYFNAVSILTIS